MEDDYSKGMGLLQDDFVFSEAECRRFQIAKQYQEVSENGMNERFIKADTEGITQVFRLKCKMNLLDEKFGPDCNKIERAF